MKLERVAAVSVLTLGVLIALGAAYLTLTRAAVRDISPRSERSTAVGIGSRQESAASVASSDVQSDVAPADPHACQQPTLAPPEEDLEPLSPVDPALSVYLPPRPGRNVIYVQVEARQVPTED